MSKSKTRRMLEHLAFAPDNDAIALLFMADNIRALKDLHGLDLSRVTEVGRGHDGSVTVRFVDRYEALDALQRDNDRESGNTLVNALVTPMRPSEDADGTFINSDGDVDVLLSDRPADLDDE